MATTKLEDVIVPERFTSYTNTLTAQKSALIQSGALEMDSSLSNLLSGGGSKFNDPSWKDLADDDANVSSDEEDDRYTGGTDNSTPKKIETLQEQQVRLSRNQSWSASDLASDLAGEDAMGSISSKVAGYRERQLQKAFIATMKGVFADNDAAPNGSDAHIQGDMVYDASGTAFSDGVTNFTARNFLSAGVTMGDANSDLTLVMAHSTVVNTMKVNNLISYVQDSISLVQIPYYQGKMVIEDDAMPFDPASGVFETWLLSGGAVKWGSGDPQTPTEVARRPDAGNGGGGEALYSRWEWIIHPCGHAFIGNPTAKGGPSNAATTGNLAHADSWSRAFPERKQIKMARLLTREFAATP